MLLRRIVTQAKNLQWRGIVTQPKKKRSNDIQLKVEQSPSLESILSMTSQKDGHIFGSTFETDIRKLLSECGFKNFYELPNNHMEVQSLKLVGGDNGKVVAEFDAIVRGGHKSFAAFSSHFLHSYANFFPNAAGDHDLMVEVKLNSGLLLDWALMKDKSDGNLQIFFNPVSNNYFKAVVINGGDESKEFVRNMHLDDPDEKYASAIKILKDARINVFYKSWASGEVFSDILLKLKELELKNKRDNDENKLKIVELELKNKRDSDENKLKFEEVQRDNDENKLKFEEVQRQLDKLLGKVTH
jgi:hypothetical protein